MYHPRGKSHGGGKTIMAARSRQMKAVRRVRHNTKHRLK